MWMRSDAAFVISWCVHGENVRVSTTRGREMLQLVRVWSSSRKRKDVVTREAGGGGRGWLAFIFHDPTLCGRARLV